MPQLFARARTPNGNPFIDSAFSTVKRAPGYPGRFLDDHEANIFRRSRSTADCGKKSSKNGAQKILPTPAAPGGKSKTKFRRAKTQQQQISNRLPRSIINLSLGSLIQKRAGNKVR
ncbi:MAG: hypothetical protein NTY84_15280 [Verrucomicrobia bacterium]|nr:hypothetical protein [Verrucomicrobiota bacterium]